MPPFLTFFTRCCRRPKLLARNLGTIRDQVGSVPVEQLLIVDRERRGLAWANERFHTHRELPRGEYVYPIDDDLWFDNLQFVKQVQLAADLNDHPDILLCRIIQRSPYWRSLPPSQVWDIAWEKGERPHRWVGAGTCVIVKTELWRPNTWRYYHGQGKDGWKTGGDWHFISNLLKLNVKVARVDTMGCTGDRGRGKVEPVSSNSWFEKATRGYHPTRIGDGVWRIEYA